MYCITHISTTLFTEHFLASRSSWFFSLPNHPPPPPPTPSISTRCPHSTSRLVRLKLEMPIFEPQNGTHLPSYTLTLLLSSKLTLHEHLSLLSPTLVPCPPRLPAVQQGIVSRPPHPCQSEGRLSHHGSSPARLLRGCREKHHWRDASAGHEYAGTWL